MQLCVFIFFYIQLGQECFSALSDNAPIGQHFLAVRNAMRFFNYILYRVSTEKNSTRVIRRYCTNYLIIYCHSTRIFFVILIITPLLQIQNITQMQRPKSNKYKSAFNKVNDWAHKVSTKLILNDSNFN